MTFPSCEATVGVVGVRHPQKSYTGISDLLATSDVGISHFQTAVKCTKRCVESHKIAHETLQNRLRQSPPPDPAWGAYNAPPDILVG